MIYITQEELNIYNAYNKHHCSYKTAKAVKKKYETVCRTLRNLVTEGLLKKQGKHYEDTGAIYRIVTLQEKISGKLPKSKIQVDMTEAEEKWMRKNYHPRKRREAAQALGRTRSDICAMAMALKIDIDSRWNHAKSNKGA